MLARSTQIYSLGSRNEQLEAIKIGLDTLKQLGISFPSKDVSRLRVYIAARRLKSLLRGRSDEDILKLPRMKDPKKLAAMQILNHVVLYTMYATPSLSALLIFKMVELTVKYGLSAIASVGFAIYGTILCRYVSRRRSFWSRHTGNDANIGLRFDDIDEGFRFGKLSLKICDTYKKAVWLCRSWAGYYGTVHARKYSVHETIEPLRTAYRAGMQAGDVEFSLVSQRRVMRDNFFAYGVNSSQTTPLF